MRLSDISRLLAVLLSGCALLATASPPRTRHGRSQRCGHPGRSQWNPRNVPTSPTAGNVTLQDHAEQWAPSENKLRAVAPPQDVPNTDRPRAGSETAGEGGPAVLGNDGEDYTAAAAYHWGTPVVELGDEFSYGDIPDPKMWDRYDSVGNGGNGLRRPDQITVQDGHLQIAGLSDGTSGGMMSSTVEPRYGRWETRMRVDKKGQGGAYHPVIALIPYGVPYNGGAGDLDFVETDAGSGEAYIFIHYPPRKQDYLSAKLDLAQWHNYGVEIAPDHITWFVDGEAVMTDTNPGAVTGSCWTMNIQLDANQADGEAPSDQQVDYFRYYPLPADGAPIVVAQSPETGSYT